MTNLEGTEIHISLHTGELSGIRIATIPFVDLQAILIPRDKLSQVRRRIEHALAVYLLLDPVQRSVYIGQSDDAWERLSYWKHKRDEEDWWGAAVALVSQTERGLSLDDINWLEWRCITAAKRIALQVTRDDGGFDVRNKREPDEPSIDGAMQGAMSGLFDSLCTLVSVLGYPVFEPPVDIDRPSVQDAISVPGPDEVFRCCGKHADATGAFAEGGFIVWKGSLARPDVVSSAKQTVEPLRQKLIDAGILTREGDKLRFAQDHRFRSVSGAAAVVLGRAADGYLEWEKDGKSLDEIMRPGGGDT